MDSIFLLEYDEQFYLWMVLQKFLFLQVDLQ